ncbi:MAG: hypothetical protein ACI9OJ_000761 [Myxococcota bacterium]|jgi:hypothetical protein
MSQHHYAAWVVLDLRLMIFVILISLFMTLGIVALFFRGRRWHEYATASFSLFIVILIVTIVVFNSIAAYPVFLVEDIFQFP